jgi:hypothetical protein
MIEKEGCEFQQAYSGFSHLLKLSIRSTLKRANNDLRDRPSAKSAGLATLRGSHLKMAMVN